MSVNAEIGFAGAGLYPDLCDIQRVCKKYSKRHQIGFRELPPMNYIVVNVSNLSTALLSQIQLYI
jgi:20S proteasome alpha/beta subunit